MEQRWNTKRDIRVSVGKETMPQFLLPSEVVTLLGRLSGLGAAGFSLFFVSSLLALF